MRYGQSQSFPETVALTAICLILAVRVCLLVSTLLLLSRANSAPATVRGVLMDLAAISRAIHSLYCKLCHVWASWYYISDTERPFGIRASSAVGSGRVRDALDGGEVPPAPSRAPSLCLATVPLTASASLNGIL